MNSRRVLWLSPWMRPLARVQAEALRRRGVDVLLVTSDRHPESDAARDYELVLDPRFRAASTWPATLAALRRIREYRPRRRDCRAGPRSALDRVGRLDATCSAGARRPPHDTAERRPAYERAVFDRWGAGSAATITYSDYVAAAVATRRDVAGTRVEVVPLTSDLDAALVPPLVGAEGRHDFVMVGRLNQYRNIDVVLDAWQRHVDGGGWRGDELVFIGDRTLIIRSLPAHARWRPGPLPLLRRRHYDRRCKGFHRPLPARLAKWRASPLYAAGRHADRFPGRGPARIPAAELPTDWYRRRCRAGRRIRRAGRPVHGDTARRRGSAPL